MTLLIELEGIPPSVNHAYKKRGKGYGMFMSKTAKEFKEYASYVAYQAMKKQKWTKIPRDENFYRMEIHFHFKNRKHPDPNNLLKVLIDSFEGIVFENDKNIDVSTFSFVDGEERTVVIFQK
ncbi:hypothetical protein LN42_01880 [Marinitoga sp. 1137]|uniref:RusA family crossover junction endodeoxyribonuclease n=1 Tax=Marinitoga sp. 1137 TaxID=1545835 RepID=UPI0009506855|nr:RusA family crossover junction endodeoxyribonuclease [Marinitoga sp. 1137]APT75048.1 hypothetical protein LN42_00525 [Marinitoga sp. 1137]APT75278.1 hypothetical protein LN42_01880 [Marinitoga sp. 1137]